MRQVTGCFNLKKKHNNLPPSAHLSHQMLDFKESNWLLHFPISDTSSLIFGCAVKRWKWGSTKPPLTLKNCEGMKKTNSFSRCIMFPTLLFLWCFCAQEQELNNIAPYSRKKKNLMSWKWLSLILTLGKHCREPSEGLHLPFLTRRKERKAAAS